MSTTGFTVFSTAHIAGDEYMSWLRQLNAVMTPEQGDAYDARLSKDTCHVWISLLEKQWFDMTTAALMKDQPEVFANLCKLLDGKPQSAIVLSANDEEGSEILAVQFAGLCAEHYPCVVLESAGLALLPREEILELRDAGMGFDGVTWETVHPVSIPSWGTRIMEEARQIEEAKRRARQEGKLSDEDDWPFERPETHLRSRVQYGTGGGASRPLRQGSV